ncbi:hypothetical protein KC571_04275, partial [candidate division WWE3 bacterium]|nr:hypothetical protein [candidate division WWE3 bacterium]
MYSAVAEQEQYQKSLIFNRAYYAQSTLGQAAYEDQQSLLESSTTGYIRSLLDASFTDKNGTLYLSETIYDDNNDEATILDQVLGTDREMYETQSMALTIGGKSINATAYIFDESSIPSTKPMRLDGDTTELMAPETMPEVYDDTAYTSATIIFTHDGFRYVLAVSGSAELSAAWESI